MIDPSIPLMAKGIDGLQMLDDGSKLAQLWQGQKTDAEMNRIYKQAGGNQAKMMELGQNSALMHLVMPQLKAQQAAQEKALLDQQKAQADIGNTNAQALERTANAGDANQKTLINRQRAISSAMAAAMSGDPKATSFMLEHGKLGGILDDSSYTQAKQFLAENANNPEAISSLVKSLGVAAAEKPEQYIQPDANTVVNNETSIANNVRDNKTSSDNNVRTTQASIYGTDKQYKSDQEKLEFDKTVQQQEESRKNGEFDTLQGSDGITYAVYKSGVNAGKVEPLLIKGGQPLKTQSQKPMSATVQRELFETDDSITAGGAAIRNLDDALGYSKNSYDGVGAVERAKAAGHFRNSEQAKNTVLLNNIMTGNALESLKATFGAAPTEGERKILLELQGSANLPRAQREAIYTRARAAAERRLTVNQKKAQGLRDGTYFTSQDNTNPQPQTPSHKGSTISLGEVKQVAQQMGISPEQAAEQLQRQGIVIR